MGRGGARPNSGKKKGPAKLYLNSCFFCGKDFAAGEKQTKFCCIECFKNDCKKRMVDGWESGKFRNEKTLQPKNCVVCGELFQPKSSDQKCCSDKCAHVQMGRTNSAKPSKVVNVCDWCGIEFVNKYRHKVHFCSDGCREASLAERRERIGFEKQRQKELNEAHALCTWCGKDFVKKFDKNKYCSPECQYEGNKRDRRNKYVSKSEGKEFVCKVCGNLFVLNAFDKAKVYCSDECRRIAKRQNSHAERKWIKWRPVIFERDDGMCQLCGYPVDKQDHETIWQASLDHIIPKSKGGNDSPENLRLAHCICNSLRNADEDKNQITLEELLPYM